MKELCDKAAENTTEPSSTQPEGSERPSTNNQIGWRKRRQVVDGNGNLKPSADTYRDSKVLVNRKRRNATGYFNTEHEYLDNLGDDYDDRYGQHSFEFNDQSDHNGDDGHGKMDSFDPYVFDPDKSFGNVLGPSESLLFRVFRIFQSILF